MQIRPFYHLSGVSPLPLDRGISSQLLQGLPSYWGFSNLGCGVSSYGRSGEAQPQLLTLDVEYLLSATASDLGRGVAPLGRSCAVQLPLLVLKIPDDPPG